MSRHHAPATEGEMDRLLLIAPTYDIVTKSCPPPLPGFTVTTVRIDNGGPIVIASGNPVQADDSWRRDRGDDGTEDER